jgi:hypothetical protein
MREINKKNTQTKNTQTKKHTNKKTHKCFFLLQLFLLY